LLLWSPTSIDTHPQPKQHNLMKALNLIAGLAFACMATTTWAQNCAGHGHASATEGKTTVESVGKAVQMNEKQMQAFKLALATCEKDCMAMASNDEKGSAKMAVVKQDRFNQAIASMKDHLEEAQYVKLETMRKNGELAGLCSADCSAKAGKSGCCAGKSGSAKSTTGAKSEDMHAPKPAVQ